MLRDAPGRYVASLAGGETVRAFVPDPLPPVPPLDLDGARQAALEQATLALGRLDSIALLLPDPQLFLYAYVRREAVLSSQIEGTQSSLSDLLLFELDEMPGVPFDDVVEVSNYVAALQHGMARLREGFPLCNRLLREMHEHLMARGRGADQAPGEFRRSQNWIGGTRPGNARFVPPPPQEVEPCMAALEAFIHGETAKLPVLLKAALVHVQFETIHPFLDGNGRVCSSPCCCTRAARWPSRCFTSASTSSSIAPAITNCWTGGVPAATGRPGSISFWKASSKPPLASCKPPAVWCTCSNGTANGSRWADAARPLSCAYSKHCASAPCPPWAGWASKPASASPPPPKPC